MSKKYNDVRINSIERNIKNNPIEQRISFATKENARYIRLIATKTVDNSSIVSYGEIGVITQ